METFGNRVFIAPRKKGKLICKSGPKATDTARDLGTDMLIASA